MHRSNITDLLRVAGGRLRVAGLGRVETGTRPGSYPRRDDRGRGGPDDRMTTRHLDEGRASGDGRRVRVKNVPISTETVAHTLDRLRDPAHSRPNGGWAMLSASLMLKVVEWGVQVVAAAKTKAQQRR
jgi:hypothetical protein